MPLPRHPFVQMPGGWLGPIIALTSLAACDKVATKVDQFQASQAQKAMAEAEGRILCATGGARELTLGCTIDRTSTQDGLYLTVRHPDGGFHRLIVAKDGRGVVAADGAQAASVTIVGKDAIEVAIADARYRLPATVKGAP